MILALIIILSSIVAVFVLKFLLDMVNVTLKVNFPVLMVVMVISIIGVILIFIQTNRINEISESKNWSTTEGIIVSSIVVGDRAFRPDVEFEYSVNGRLYSQTTDLQMPPFGGRRSKYDAANKLAGMFPEGKSVEVHYNPEMPSSSKLKTGIPVEIYLRLSFGTFLLCIGLFISFNYISRKT